MGPGLQHLTPAAFVAHGEIRLVNKMLTVLSWETWVNRNSTITSSVPAAPPAVSDTSSVPMVGHAPLADGQGFGRAMERAARPGTETGSRNHDSPVLRLSAPVGVEPWPARHADRAGVGYDARRRPALEWSATPKGAEGRTGNAHARCATVNANWKGLSGWPTNHN